MVMSCGSAKAPTAPMVEVQQPIMLADPLAGIAIELEASYRDYLEDLEVRIIDRQGGHFSPYTLSCFSDLTETDIEHIVAKAEAYDSGLNYASPDTKILFEYDLENLTTAEPGLNRHEKSDKDPAQWMPEHNKCWYVATWIRVKRKYGLSMDQAEADAIRAVYVTCEPAAFDLVPPPCAGG